MPAGEVPPVESILKRPREKLHFNVIRDTTARRDGCAQGTTPNVIPRRLLIGYDGSAEARDAIKTAADVCENGTAVVVNVWDVLSPASIAAPELAAAAQPPREVVSASAGERAAIRCARDGADLAHEAGLASEFAACHGSGVEGIATALVDAADRWNADLIVVGRRDKSRIREFVLGSVSHAVVRAANRPVLVVPAGGDVADTRAPA